jgi:LEA14-like dessication related protein
MKKTIPWLLLLAGLLAGGIWLYRGLTKPAGTEGSLKPELGVAAVRVTDLDAERIKMDVGLKLSNPTPVELNTSRVDYRILIDSVPVIESSYRQPIRIASSDSTVVQVPMEVLREPLGKILKRFKEQGIDSAQYRLEATIFADVPIAGEREFNLEKSARLPAFQLPDMKIEDVKIGKLGLKESSLDVTIRLFNPNVFPIKIKNAQYTIRVGEESEIEGQLQELVNVPAKGSAPIATHTDVEKGGKLALKFLFDKKDTPFRLDYRGELLTDSEYLEDSRIALRVEGTLDELTKMK